MRQYMLSVCCFCSGFATSGVCLSGLYTFAPTVAGEQEGKRPNNHILLYHTFYHTALSLLALLFSTLCLLNHFKSASIHWGLWGSHHTIFVHTNTTDWREQLEWATPTFGGTKIAFASDATIKQDSTVGYHRMLIIQTIHISIHSIFIIFYTFIWNIRGWMDGGGWVPEEYCKWHQIFIL